MYLNDIEDYDILNDFYDIDLEYLKLFLLLYADYIVIMSAIEEGVHKGILLLDG